MMELGAMSDKVNSREPISPPAGKVDPPAPAQTRAQGPPVESADSPCLLSRLILESEVA